MRAARQGGLAGLKRTAIPGVCGQKRTAPQLSPYTYVPFDGGAAAEVSLKKGTKAKRACLTAKTAKRLRRERASLQLMDKLSLEEKMTEKQVRLLVLPTRGARARLQHKPAALHLARPML